MGIEGKAVLSTDKQMRVKKTEEHKLLSTKK